MWVDSWALGSIIIAKLHSLLPVQTEKFNLLKKSYLFVAYLQFFLETKRPQELIYALVLLKNFSVALLSKWQIDGIVSSFYNYWESKDVKKVQTPQKSIRGVSGKHNPEKPKISNSQTFSR